LWRDLQNSIKEISLALFLLGCAQAWAGEVLIAVAANFASPLEKIATAFEQETGHRANFSIGSTGKFYAQIKNAAPYQVLLAADEETPAKLDREGFTEPGSRFTYATGKLVLWSKQPGLIDEAGDVLKKNAFKHIAIADPKLAPYGLAALQTLAKLGLEKQIMSKTVWGENIGQAYLFVESQSAELGFVALSQVYLDGHIKEGSAWQVPQSMHSPIRQDAVLLSSGKNTPAAKAFMSYLRSKRAKDIIKSYGYE